MKRGFLLSEATALLPLAEGVVDHLFAGAALFEAEDRPLTGGHAHRQVDPVAAHEQLRVARYISLEVGEADEEQVLAHGHRQTCDRSSPCSLLALELEQAHVTDHPV